MDIEVLERFQSHAGSIEALRFQAVRGRRESYPFLHPVRHEYNTGRVGCQGVRVPPCARGRRGVRGSLFRRKASCSSKYLVSGINQTIIFLNGRRMVDSKGSLNKPSADPRWPDFPWGSAEGFCAR